MFRIDIDQNRIEPLEDKEFKDLNFTERSHHSPIAKGAGYKK